jgi:mono/diheme cytochrome c family protein
VGDFALIDHQGTQHHMAWYDDHQAVVILPQGVGSTDADALAALQELQAAYSGQAVKFFLLNPGLQTDRAAVAADLNAEFQVLMDDAQVVSEALGLSKMDEAVVYNPRNFEIVYRGPVQAELTHAVEQLLAGNNPDLVALSGDGASIAHQGVDGAGLDYANDIAPIIAENCAECHREGGIAPFAMDNKLAVQGWSPMIREVVMTKRMPPGQIDNKVGHKMANEMNLQDDEIQKLVRWVNAGSPAQGDADPLTALTWPDTKWQLAAELGDPDLIVKVPPQTIPATGIVDYMDIPLDLGLTEDRWVRASEVAPDKAEVLHHIITTVVPPGGPADPQAAFLAAINSLPPERAQAIRAEMFTAIAAGQQPNIDKIFRENPDIDVGVLLGGGDPSQASIAGYAPGNSFQLNPEGVGGVLKAGSSLSLQMHYTTSGKEVTDETEIAIYFYPEGYVPEERMSGGVGNAFTIEIPAGAKDHEMELVTYIGKDSEIHSLMPHMHFRGKRMAFTARYPDGSEELLLSVPAYSFNWQLSHELAEPLKVPAGTQIIATGAFDNSAQNPYNPDPDIEVNWGEQSWEEMFMGFYTWKELGGGE